MKPPQRVEIAVIGAGPAGSTLAAALAMRGREVALFERDQFPRDKVCGEFLSPEAIDCMAEIGCEISFRSLAPSQMNRTRLSTADGAELTVPLPGEAYGLSRKRLDAFLFDRARRSGALTFDGTEVEQIEHLSRGRKRLNLRLRSDEARSRHHRVDADIVVGAHGRRSKLDRQLKRPFFERRSPFVAFKRHHRQVRIDPDNPPLEGCVELHAFDGGYCGVSFVEEGIVNVCSIFDRRILNRDEPLNKDSFWAFLSRGDSPLARRLSTLETCDTETVTVAQIPMMTRQISRENILFVGDSAAMIAPLAGDGQAMAMESALTLADLLCTHLPEIPRRRWNYLWRRRYEPRVRLGQWIHGAMIRPRLATPALRLLQRMPWAASALIRLTRG